MFNDIRRGKLWWIHFESSIQIAEWWIPWLFTPLSLPTDLSHRAFQKVGSKFSLGGNLNFKTGKTFTKVEFCPLLKVSYSLPFPPLHTPRSWWVVVITAWRWQDAAWSHVTHRPCRAPDVPKQTLILCRHKENRLITFSMNHGYK